MNGGWWRMLGVGALSLSLCVQAQADDGRGDAVEPAASAVLPTDNRDLAAAKRTAAVGDRIPTGVRAGWWRPCRAGTCGCPIAAASISSTTATGTDPTARAMCWSCRPAGARPQPAALCGAGLAGQRAVLPCRRHLLPVACRHPRVRSGQPAAAGSGTRLSGQRAGRQLRRGGLPARGQGPDQQGRDRYECHRWAVGESGFDPAGATYAPAAEVANGYRRAMAACLSGRGYSVN